MLTANQVEENVERYIESCESADVLLMEVAKGGELSPHGVTLLRSVGISERPEIERHVARLQSILRHQQIAGAEDDRRKLTTKIKSAKAKLDKEVPAIRKELEDTVARLQGQIDKLEAAYNVPARKLEIMEQAVENLRTVRSLPQFAQDKYNILKSNVKKSFSGLVEAKGIVANRTQLLEMIEQLIPQLNNKIALGNSATPQREVHQLVSRERLWEDSEVPGEIYTAKASSQKVMAFKAKCETELANAQKIVDDAGTEFEDRLAEVEEHRNHYVL